MAHRKQGSNNAKAIMYIIESLRLFVRIMGFLGKVIHHTLSIYLLLFRPEAANCDTTHDGVKIISLSLIIVLK